MRLSPRVLMVAAVLLLLPGATGLSFPEDAPAKPPGVRGDIIAAIEDARGKLLELAEAMPANKYAWRPGKGVRSVGEVYQHVAQANYLLPTLIGIKAPEDLKLRDLDKQVMDKEHTIRLLKQSFDHATEAVRNTPDADLEKTVRIFDHDGTTREVLLALVTHAHEHLGQSIAYARTNAIVPPWTARTEAEQAAKIKAPAKAK